MHIFAGIPSAGHPHPWFTQSLANMVARATREGVTGPDDKLVQPLIQTHVEIGKLPMVRNRLLKLAMDSGASHMLWLDDDHIFPDWTLARLTKANREVIGINQPTRTRPHVPTARTIKSEPIYSSEEDAKKGLVEQVGMIGFAVVLMQMGVVAKLQADAERKGRDLFPVFNFTLTSDPFVSGGEDGHFCGRCAEAGVPIYLDHMLSWASFHAAELPVGMADTLRDRAAAESLARR